MSMLRCILGIVSGVFGVALFLTYYKKPTPAKPAPVKTTSYADAIKADKPPAPKPRGPRPDKPTTVPVVKVPCVDTGICSGPCAIDVCATTVTDAVTATVNDAVDTSTATVEIAQQHVEDKIDQVVDHLEEATQEAVAKIPTTSVSDNFDEEEVQEDQTKEMVDTFIDSFKGGEKIHDVNVEVNAPQDDTESAITPDFCEETLIQPVMRQQSFGANEISGVTLDDYKRSKEAVKDEFHDDLQEMIQELTDSQEMLDNILAESKMKAQDKIEVVQEEIVKSSMDANDEYSQEIKNVAESAFEQINQESVTDVDFEKITQELTQKVESVEREVEELVRDIDSCEEDIILGEDESAQDDSADEEITLSENGSDLEDVSDLEADAKLKSSQAEGERKNEREEGGDDMSIPSPGELDIPLLTPVMRPDEPSPTADTPSVMSVAGDEQKFFPETNDFRNDYENEFEHFERSNNFQNDSPVGSEPGDALYDYVEEDLEPGDDVNELIEANRISVIEVAKNNMPNIPSSEDFGILPPAPLSPFDAMIDHEQNELVNSSVETVEEDDDEEEVPYKAYHADPVKSAMTEAAMPDSSLDRKSKSEEFLEEFFTKTKIEKVVDELEQNVSADNETFSVSMESVSKEASEPTRIEVDVPKSSPRIIKSTVKISNSLEYPSE